MVMLCHVMILTLLPLGHKITFLHYYTDLILSDNCHWSIPIVLLNLQSPDMQ
jgi:hypothetical protein